jgi:hypothetical protein
MQERVSGKEGRFTTRLYLPGKALHFQKPQKGTERLEEASEFYRLHRAAHCIVFELRTVESISTLSSSLSCISCHTLFPFLSSLFSLSPYTAHSYSMFHSKKPFTPHFAPTSDFFDFAVSPTMGRDHLPDRYVLEISKVLAQWDA